MRPLSPNLSATSLIRDTKKPMGHGRKAIETTPLSHWLYKPIPLRYQPYPIEMLLTTGNLKNKKWMHNRIFLFNERECTTAERIRPCPFSKLTISNLSSSKCSIRDEITEIGVISKSADYMKSHFKCAIHKGGFGEVGIRNHIVCQSLKCFLACTRHM